MIYLLELGTSSFLISVYGQVINLTNKKFFFFSKIKNWLFKNEIKIKKQGQKQSITQAFPV
jgi:hypothetical protein